MDNRTRTSASVAGLRRLAAGLALTGAAATAANAQGNTADPIPWTYTTRFEGSAAAVDTAQYQTIETCLAAIERTYDRTKMDSWLATKLWPDSLPPDDPRMASTRGWGGQGHWRLTPLPDTVVAMARRCTAGITPDSALSNKGKLENLIEAYLAANRDAEVTAFVAKQLAAVSGAKRDALVDTVVQVYKKVQPVRQAAGEALLEQRLQEVGTDGMMRIPVLYDLFQVAQLVGDTATQRKRAEEMEAAWEQMPAAQRDTLSEALKKPGNPRTGHGDTTEVVRGPREGRELLHWAALLDSAKQGTAAFLRGQQVLIDAEPVATDTGEMQPAVQADYWFPETPGDTVRPRKGRVELIIDLRSETGQDGLCSPLGRDAETLEWWPSMMNPSCVQLFATVRRLAKRFPELGITVVAYTSGVVFQRAVADPKEEVEMLRHWLRDVEHLPGTLAVMAYPMPIPRRPDPDRRINYRGWIPWGPREGSTLVGRDGRVLMGRVKPTERPDPDPAVARWIANDRAGFGLYQEQKYTALIAAALQQPAK